MKSLFDHLYYRVWTFLRPGDNSMRPSRFSRLLTIIRDVAAIIAILWAFLIYAFPSVQRLSDQQFGIAAHYFMGEYRICVSKTGAEPTSGPGETLEDKYCWVQVEEEARLCTPASAEQSPCISPIAENGDTEEQWKTAEFIKERGFQYGYETQKSRFYHLKWRLDEGQRKGVSETSEDWDYKKADRAALDRLSATGDLVVVPAGKKGVDIFLPGREKVDWAPATAAETYTNGHVLTIAETGDCLFVDRTHRTGPLAATTDYPNNVYAKMVKVSCL